jgi:hypothetical protein
MRVVFNESAADRFELVRSEIAAAFDEQNTPAGFGKRIAECGATHAGTDDDGVPGDRFRVQHVGWERF